MGIDQGSLVASLTDSMNESMTSWVISGHYNLPYLVGKLLSAVPLLSDSTAQYDGFAYSSQGKSRWICLDADMGSAIFLFPEDPTLFNREMHGSVLGLRSELNVNPAIYGNVDPVLWQTVGDGRVVIEAAGFLPAAEE